VVLLGDVNCRFGQESAKACTGWLGQRVLFVRIGFSNSQQERIGRRFVSCAKKTVRSLNLQPIILSRPPLLLLDF
jgi:hypothetical protein